MKGRVMRADFSNRQHCRGNHRRAFLADTGMSLAGVALASLLDRDGRGWGRHWLAVRPMAKPHFSTQGEEYNLAVHARWH